MLRRSRSWYLAVLVLLSLSIVAGGAGFFVQQNPWDLLWPAIDVITVGLLVAIPQSRDHFAEPNR